MTVLNLWKANFGWLVMALDSVVTCFCVKHLVDVQLLVS